MSATHALSAAERAELEYLRAFSDKARGIAESPLEGATIEGSARALWEYVSTEAGKHRPWATTNPWETPRVSVGEVPQ